MPRLDRTIERIDLIGDDRHVVRLRQDALYYPIYRYHHAPTLEDGEKHGLTYRAERLLNSTAFRPRESEPLHKGLGACELAGGQGPSKEQQQMPDLEPITVARRSDGSFAPLELDLKKKYQVRVLGIPTLDVVLHDENKLVMANTPYRILIGDRAPLEGRSDADGRVHTRLPPECPERITLRWGPQPESPLAHYLELFPSCNEGSQQFQTLARLNNLGYPATIDLDTAVCKFQMDFAVDHEPEPVGLVNGVLPTQTQQRLDQLFTRGRLDGKRFTTNQTSDPSVAAKEDPVVPRPNFLPSLGRFTRPRRDLPEFIIPVRVSCFEILRLAGLTNREIWQFFRSCVAEGFSFLGRALQPAHYLHEDLVKELRAHEEALLPSPRPDSKVAIAKLGTDLGLHPRMEPFSGSRSSPTSAALSMHLFGLAIDLDPLTQFHITSVPLTKDSSKPDKDLRSPRDVLDVILGHGQLLMDPSGTGWRWPSTRPPTLDEILNVNAKLVSYFGLPKNPTELTRKASALTPLPHSDIWLEARNQPSLPERENLIRAVIAEDILTLLRQTKSDQLATPKRAELLTEVLQTRGILGMSFSLIRELQTSLDWLADDGDLMHFDMRNQGKGKQIQDAVRVYKAQSDEGELLESLTKLWKFGADTLPKKGTKDRKPDLSKEVTGDALEEMEKRFLEEYPDR